VTAVARATIVHQWSDGSAAKFTAACDAEHSDALDQLTTRVLRMYREAVLEPDQAES
jgi:hypothetical protein